MKPETVRTSLDLPRDLHRRLHELAAQEGCSARQLILRSIEKVLQESEPRRPRRRLSLEEPIVPSRGGVIDPTEDELYGDFP